MYMRVSLGGRCWYGGDFEAGVTSSISSAFQPELSDMAPLGHIVQPKLE